MSEIYNENIADEKLKNGTKYEKLTAIAYKCINKERMVNQYISLDGESKST